MCTARAMTKQGFRKFVFKSRSQKYAVSCGKVTGFCKLTNYFHVTHGLMAGSR